MQNATKRTRKNPFSIEEQLKETWGRIKGWVSFNLLWELLTLDERGRLGDDPDKAWREFGTVGAWKRLRGVSQVRAIIDLARFLNLIDENRQRWLLAQTEEVGASIDDSITAATQKCELVLCEAPRQMLFWMGEPIAMKWDQHKSMWSYLWQLGRKAKRGLALERADLLSSRDRCYLAKLKSRLSKSPDFPLELIDRIESVGRGSQRLRVEPDQIRIFGVDTFDILKEHLVSAES